MDTTSSSRSLNKPSRPDSVLSVYILHLATLRVFILTPSSTAFSPSRHARSFPSPPSRLHLTRDPRRPPPLSLPSPPLPLSLQWPHELVAQRGGLAASDERGSPPVKAGSSSHGGGALSKRWPHIQWRRGSNDARVEPSLSLSCGAWGPVAGGLPLLLGAWGRRRPPSRGSSRPCRISWWSDLSGGNLLQWIRHLQ